MPAVLGPKSRLCMKLNQDEWSYMSPELGTMWQLILGSYFYILKTSASVIALSIPDISMSSFK